MFCRTNIKTFARLNLIFVSSFNSNKGNGKDTFRFRWVYSPTSCRWWLQSVDADIGFPPFCPLNQNKENRQNLLQIVSKLSWQSSRWGGKAQLWSALLKSNWLEGVRNSTELKSARTRAIQNFPGLVRLINCLQFNQQSILIW